MRYLRDLILAVSFLTRVPLRLDKPRGAGALAQATWAFPVVGLGVGLAGAAVYGMGQWLGLSAFVAAALAVGAQAWITGALHEDALADVSDGFGGGGTRERKLDIMRDSRVGSFGVFVLCLFLLLRVGAIAAVASPLHVAVLLASTGALSRAAVVGLMTFLPSARNDGLASLAGRPQPTRFILAIVLAAFPMLAAPDAAWVVGLFGGGLVGAVIVASMAWRHIGGHTGDVLGACQQGSELVALLAVAAMVG